MEGRLQRRPTRAEIAADMGLTEDKLRAILPLTKEPASLDAPLSVESGFALVDLLKDETTPGPEAVYLENRFRSDMQRLLSCLTPREERIICMRFGMRNHKPHTLEETGQILGVTRERIRQIEAMALKKLRRHPELRRLARCP
jgi:RNA polymerase primary sigma factor